MGSCTLYPGRLDPPENRHGKDAAPAAVVAAILFKALAACALDLVNTCGEYADLGRWRDQEACAWS